MLFSVVFFSGSFEMLGDIIFWNLCLKYEVQSQDHVKLHDAWPFQKGVFLKPYWASV
jgi:hypothetical protein